MIAFGRTPIELCVFFVRPGRPVIVIKGDESYRPMLEGIYVFLSAPIECIPTIPGSRRRWLFGPRLVMSSDHPRLANLVRIARRPRAPENTPHRATQRSLLDLIAEKGRHQAPRMHCQPRVFRDLRRGEDYAKLIDTGPSQDCQGLSVA
jgi:hypothetical protein